jgi:hypothetical protein
MTWVTRHRPRFVVPAVCPAAARALQELNPTGAITVR